MCAGRAGHPAPETFYDGHLPMGCEMFDRRRVTAVVIAIGLSIEILLVSGQAFGDEGIKTRIIVERQDCIFGRYEPLPVYLNDEYVGDVLSGGTLEVQRLLSADEANVVKVETKRGCHIFSEIHFLPDSSTIRLRVSVEVGWWQNRLKLEALSGTLVEGAGSVPRITLAEKTILKKVASEEYRAVEGFSVQASRSTTWERGVSLSRTSESLREAGLNLKILEARIGKRVADMLASDIREATTAGSTATIDGNVWERLRIDWYAIIRPGKAFLEADGVQREVVFEYIVGYKPVPAGGKRRNQGAGGAIEEDDPFGSDYSDEITPLGTEQPRGRNPLISTSYR